MMIAAAHLTGRISTRGEDGERFSRSRPDGSSKWASAPNRMGGAEITWVERTHGDSLTTTFIGFDTDDGPFNFQHAPNEELFEVDS